MSDGFDDLQGYTGQKSKSEGMYCVTERPADNAVTAEQF